MPLPSSGAISLSDVQAEFGGTNPISISEYYGKDTVPASGTISLNDFYGTSAAPPFNAIWSGSSFSNTSVIKGIQTSSSLWRFRNDGGSSEANGPTGTWLMCYTSGLLQVGTSIPNNLGIIVQSNATQVSWKFVTSEITGLVTFGISSGWTGSSVGGYYGADMGFFTSGGSIRYGDGVASIGPWITLT
jgi:hypothetical protein